MRGAGGGPGVVEGRRCAEALAEGRREEERRVKRVRDGGRARKGGCERDPRGSRLPGTGWRKGRGARGRVVRDG